jgi:hypothetical protein
MCYSGGPQFESRHKSQLSSVRCFWMSRGTPGEFHDCISFNFLKFAHSVEWLGSGFDNRRSVPCRGNAGTFFLFAILSRPALGPTQPTSQETLSFMEPEGSTLCSQGPFICPCPKPHHPVHTFPSYHRKIVLILSFPSTPSSSNWSLPFRFSNQNMLCIFRLSHSCYMPRSFHIP